MMVSSSSSDPTPALVRRELLGFALIIHGLADKNPTIAHGLQVSVRAPYCHMKEGISLFFLGPQLLSIQEGNQ